MPRRRRRLFGQLVTGLGARARATPTGVKPEKAVEQRERQQKSQQLERGGRNKGEELGYGGTAGYRDG